MTCNAEYRKYHVAATEDHAKLIAERDAYKADAAEQTKLANFWRCAYFETKDVNQIYADRYRWLRDRDEDTISHGGVFAGQTPENFILTGDDLDAAIDKERSAG